MKNFVSNAFGSKNNIEKYTYSRNKISDLYLSEKKFFIPSVKKSKTFLDFGCATGNFINIIDKLTQIKNFTGLDVSNDMLKRARLLHPKNKFKKFNGNKIMLNGKFNLVFSFGTLIYCANYKKIIDDLINYSNKFINFDVRLVFGKSINNKNISYQIISKKPLITLPYILINFSEFVEFLLKITNCRYKISFFGYKHSVAKNVVSTYKKVFMVSVLIEKTEKFSLNMNILE